MFDLVIKNGMIFNGTGNPWFYGDIGIIGDKIACIGQINPEAKEVIDAEKMCVAPGFIDIHTHSDFTILENPKGESKIRQGVTTELGGHCGFSLAPVKDQYLEEMKKFTSFIPANLKWNWRTIRDYLARIEENGTSINFCTLVGHGVLRISAMGFENRPATPEEIKEMEKNLEQALDEGAMGLSAGLVYAPGSFANKDEFKSLLKIVAKKEKIFAAHVRDEGDGVEEAIEEVLTLAEETGVKLQICHLKATGKANWDKMEKLIEKIERTREKGFDVTFDVYPYNALNTLLTALLPGWFQAGGVGAIVKRTEDPEARKRVRPQLEKESLKYGGWENIMVASVKKDTNKWIEGKTIQEAANQKEKEPVEIVLDLLHDDECGTMVVCFSMSEDNVIKALSHPLSMLGSDGKSLATEGPLSAGRPHPRNFGAFPRFISKYVREDKSISLQEAIRKMTSAPAQKLGLRRRGLLLEGYYADIVVFDYNTIRDTATFVYPQQYPVGIKYVIVNGKITIKNGEHTGALNGAVLK